MPDSRPYICNQADKSSQVKSSSNFNGGRARRLWGARRRRRRRERSGGRGAAQLRDWHGWIALSRGFIHIVFFLIIAAPQVTNFVLYSGSLQYGNATRLQSDDGSDGGHLRGHLRVLLRWAEVPVGSGDRRHRASSARGPSPTSFGVLGLTRAHQSFLARQQGRLARRRQLDSWLRAFLWCAPHTPPSISHMHARLRHTGVASMAAREADGRREQLRERASAGCVRPDGGGARGGSSEAGGAYEGDGVGFMGCEGVDGLSNDWRRMKRA